MWSGRKRRIYLFLNLILYLLIFIFILAVVGLQRSAWAFSSCGKPGLPLSAVQGLLIAAVSPVVEHRL